MLSRVFNYHETTAQEAREELERTGFLENVVFLLCVCNIDTHHVTFSTEVREAIDYANEQERDGHVVEIAVIDLETGEYEYYARAKPVIPGLQYNTSPWWGRD